jgi:C-terminal processing protease CtpA/Prc
VLLIGPETISGGETFAMALMGRAPRVTLVGENTQGVFSDVWGRKLPNGWTFGVPTELYLTRSGKSFDAEGVPPAIRVSVFPRADLEVGRDGALERAIRVILARSPGRRP